MKKIQYLARAYGECLNTPYDIVEEYIGQEYDKEAMKGCILSNDDWRPCSKPLYTILEVEIPEFMEPAEFNPITWKYYVRCGGSEELGRRVYERLTSLENGALRLACLQLLNTKSFKSSYRESLKNQLQTWVSDDEPKYKEPFSSKQYMSIVNPYVIKEAKRIGVI